MTEFRILGPFEVSEANGALVISGAKERATLAILLLHANHLVPAERLIDALWDADPPASARNSLQVRIAGVRKVLGADRIESQAGGYLVRVQPDEFDLARFERLLQLGGRDDLEEALTLWRGPALADFAGERWAAAPIARLEDMRLAALEERIEADLELGRHRELVPELEWHVAQHPLRERLRGQLMLALYRSGRQADALGAYQTGRNVLIDQLGIEPHPAIRDLEMAILQQDPGLDLEQTGLPERCILVAALDEARLPGLVDLAEPLAHRPRRVLILARPADPDADLGATAAVLDAHSDRLRARNIVARPAAFRSSAPGVDIARLAAEQDVDLVVVDAPANPLGDADVVALIDSAPCDVAVVVEGRLGDGPVLVPFTGAEHDWSAIEIGAWLARARAVPIRLVGPVEEDRDASRLLASASLAIQRALGVRVETLLLERGPASLVKASADAAVTVVGLSERWRADGLGSARSALVERPMAPVVVVHRGLRPGGLAPPDAYSRFTWSLLARA